MNFFKNWIEDYKWAASYGGLSFHLKECFYYNKWFLLPINWLDKKYRYLGPSFDWYDGPHYSFGFWFFNISSSPVNIIVIKENPNSLQFINDSIIIRSIKKLKKKIRGING
jgi:hypothetical protein